MYQLEYLPIARLDMIDIIRYLSHDLCNPIAAERLSEEMIETADRLIGFPYINAVYHAMKPLKKEYRKFIVRNYIIFYWIDEEEKKVTIARVIYARRDNERLLK